MPGGRVRASSAKQQEDVSAGIDLLASIQDLQLQAMQPSEVFLFLVSRIPGLRMFEPVWSLSGAALMAFKPQTFVHALQLEFLSFPRTLAVEVFKVIQKKIMDQAQVTSTDDSSNAIDGFDFSAWSNSSTML